MSELARRPISVSSSSAGSSVSSLDCVVEEEGSENVIVDLTVEGDNAEDVAVVDLTSQQKHKTRKARTRQTRTRQHKACDDDDAIFISGGEEDNDVIIVPSPRPPPTATPSTTSHSATPLPTSPGITCPICLDSKRVFTAAGRSVVTTTCGHIFCDSCIRQSIQLMHKCPTCKKKLTLKQYHKIFI